MALPADFPPPPKPPPVPLTDDKTWRDYHATVARYIVALVEALKA